MDALFIPKNSKGMSDSKIFLRLFERQPNQEKRSLLKQELSGTYSKGDVKHFKFPTVQFTTSIL